MTALADLTLNDIALDTRALTLSGCPEGFDAMVCADLARGAGNGVSVFVARDFGRLNAVIDQFRFFAPELETLTFPAWDCLPYDRMSPTPGVVASRMYALSKLAQWKRQKPQAPVLLLTTANALTQKVPPLSVIDEGRLSLKPGATIDIAELDAYFVKHGYSRVSTVSERGEFAVRGGILDVFSPSLNEPVRLDFFGDSLESIRSFDAETQRSLKQIQSLDFTAVSEIRLDPDSISRFRENYLKSFGAAGDDPLYAALSAGIRRQGIEHLLPLFYDRLDTGFDYLPPQTLLMLDALADNAVAERQDMVRDAYQLRADAAGKKDSGGYRALPPQKLYLEDGEWTKALNAQRVRRFEPFEREGSSVIDLGGRPGRNFAEARLLDATNLFAAVTDHAN
ncbi:MAG: transcription-repair coupling factor, partial [Asticcacaulis sp.]